MLQKNPSKKKNALDVNAHNPLGLQEFERLMIALPALMAALPALETPRMAIAVSGGADSMALLLLASQWAKKYQGEITALTVDHGLRAESADEATQVGAWCKQHHITHHTMRWSSPPLTSAIQEQARNARYQLLAQWCHEHDIPHLLTAHHRDDQAETFFFRLARSSGLDGLACMQPSMELQHGVVLLRPLLPVAKARLIAYLRAINQPWLEDPSNKNHDYTRSRIRALLEKTGNADSISERAYAITLSLSKLRKVLEHNTVTQLTICIISHSEDETLLDASKVLALEPEYGLRVVSSVIKQVGKSLQKPRSENLNRFYQQLCEDISLGKFQRRSFGHCIFELKPNTMSQTGVIRVRPEAITRRSTL